MKRLFALFFVLVLAAPAPAHFIWIVPTKAPIAAQLVFSDELAPDTNVPITKIAQTQVFVRAGGKTYDVKKYEEKDHYRLVAAPVSLAPLEFGGVCRYGVAGKKDVPFLLNYYAKATIGVNNDLKAWDKLPLEIVGSDGNYLVLWQGKTLYQDVEMTAIVPGEDAPRQLAQKNKKGYFELGPVEAKGLIGLRAKYVEKKEGELDGSKYKEIRHYSTWTFSSAGKAAPAKADPAATKLLADARAGRAVWNNFPGFSADLDVNVNGTVTKGKVDVASSGKLTLKLDGDDTAVRDWTRRTLASLVMHRLPGTSDATPCAFLDTVAKHPSGRAIRVLNDELHSSYRIRDGQIIEVNRAMKDTRFTITVLENIWTKEKKYLPVAYVVSTWDLKTGALVSSSAHHDTWTRIGAFDLPATVRVVNAKAGELDNRLITFSNLQLAK